MRSSVDSAGRPTNDEFGDDDANPSSETPDEQVAATPAALLDQRRPNVSGDLRTMFQAAPMFRRAIGGYSRFHVDTYVQWAEDELAAAARENDDLLARYAQVRSELEEAQQLLAHSPGGAEFLRLSHRIGGMLAAAADQAEGLRTEAQAHRAAAATEADHVLTVATAEAERILAEGSAQAERILAEAREAREDADRVLTEAELTAQNARAEAAAHLEEARATQQRALEEAERLRQAAAEESAAIRLQAQHEGVRLLSRGREERLRSEAEAAALRERLDQEAAARRAAVMADVEQLEQRRALLAALVSASPEPAAAGRRGRRRRARGGQPVLPAPREVSLASSADGPGVRVWKWHVRLPHPHHEGSVR